MASVEHPDLPATGRARAVYTRVQVLGLVLAAVTILVVSIIAVVADPGSLQETVSFFVPVAAVMLVAAVLSWRFGTWARILGIVVSLAAAALLFWTVFGLAAPDSFVDFAAGVGIPAGILLGIGGGAAALVAARRGRVQVEAARSERFLVRGVVLSVMVALAVSGVLTVLGRSTVDPALASGATTVGMSGFEFVPAEIQLDASEARLLVTNNDAFLHDLAVPALDSIVRVTPGSSELLDLSGAAPGTYTVYCTLHSDTRVEDPAAAGMAATLIVH